MRTILLLLLGLIPALPAIAQQAPPSGILIDQGSAPQEDRAAAEAKRQAEAVERCKADRGTDCDTDAGLAEWRDRSRRESEERRTLDQTTPTPTPQPAK
jgi:hypothetical protein